MFLYETYLNSIDIGINLIFKYVCLFWTSRTMTSTSLFLKSFNIIYRVIRIIHITHNLK